jgi:septum formation protein
VVELHSIVLASASPRRYDLLTSLGLQVDVKPSGIEEGDRPGYGPRELATFHASAKADASVRAGCTGLIVAADTVVDLDGKALGKPTTPANAVATLRSLAGRSHFVHTAYTAIDTGSGRRIDGGSTTHVTFVSLVDGDISAYVATGDPMDKAGAYGIQGRGAALVERIDGDFYTVMGFPLGDFVRRLPELGYTLPATRVTA